jgi:DnaK suppressor protein
MALNRSQRVNLRKLLDERHEHLGREVVTDGTGGNRIHVVMQDDGVRDIGDEAVAVLEADTHLALLNRRSAEVQELDRAYLRLRTADYGLCCECGEDIGFKRLQVHPLAERCLSCQELHERTHPTYRS